MNVDIICNINGKLFYHDRRTSRHGQLNKDYFIIFLHCTIITYYIVIQVHRFKN